MLVLVAFCEEKKKMGWEAEKKTSLLLHATQMEPMKEKRNCLKMLLWESKKGMRGSASRAYGTNKN